MSTSRTGAVGSSCRKRRAIWPKPSGPVAGTQQRLSGPLWGQQLPPGQRIMQWVWTDSAPAFTSDTSGPHDLPDDIRQQGIVGAAQDQHVQPLLPQRLQILTGHRLNDHVAGLIAAVFPPAAPAADRPGSPWMVSSSRCSVRSIGAAADGGGGGDEAHPPVPGHGRRLPAGGLHHPRMGRSFSACSWGRAVVDTVPRPPALP